MATIYSLETDLAAANERADRAEREVLKLRHTLEQRDMVLATVKGDVDLAFDNTADGNARAYARDRIRAALDGCALMVVSAGTYAKAQARTEKAEADVVKMWEWRARAENAERDLALARVTCDLVDALRADNERLRGQNHAMACVVATGGNVTLSPKEYANLQAAIGERFGLMPRCESTRAVGANLDQTERCAGTKGHRGVCFGGVPPCP
jgi:hypothetical protein